MFSEVVGQIVSTVSPVDIELPLFDAVFDPVKTHIHCFGSSLFDGVVGNAGGASVVSLDGGGGLRMTRVGQDGTQHGGLFAVVEQSTQFGFSSGRENDGHDGGVDVDGAIETRWWLRCRQRRCMGVGQRVA